MQGNMMTMLSKDASEWDDLSGTGITNAFESYNNWKNNTTINSGDSALNVGNVLSGLNTAFD